MITDDLMKELFSLCEEYARLTNEREQIARRVETLLVPKEPEPETNDDVIKVGDLVELVSSVGNHTFSSDIGKGGIVEEISNDIALLVEHKTHKLPACGYASLSDCRKVAAHARPVTP